MDDRDLKTHQLETVVADNLRLKEENARLRQFLAEKGITIPAPPKKDLSLATAIDAHDAGVNEHSSKDVKVGLFRGLFRGREDVYAVRMRFKSGDWGYVPASIRDWKASVRGSSFLVFWSTFFRTAASADRTGSSKPSKALFRSAWRLCDRIFCTSTRETCLLRCSIGCYGWPPSRIPSFTRRRQCASPPSASPGLSPAVTSLHSMLRSRAAAWWK